MKVASVVKFNMPFEVWNPVLNGSTITYESGGADAGLFIANTNGFLLTTEDQLAEGTQIRNAKDRKGNPLFLASGTTYAVYVNSVEPQFDPFGSIVGWKHTLKRTQSRDVAKMLADRGL